MIPKWIHVVIISFLVSFLTWFIISSLLIEISFFKYYLLELIVLLSFKLYIFTLNKFIYNSTDNNGKFDTY